MGYLLIIYICVYSAALKYDTCQRKVINVLSPVLGQVASDTCSPL